MRQSNLRKKVSRKLILPPLQRLTQFNLGHRPVWMVVNRHRLLLFQALAPLITRAPKALGNLRQIPRLALPMLNNRRSLRRRQKPRVRRLLPGPNPKLPPSRRKHPGQLLPAI